MAVKTVGQRFAESEQYTNARDAKRLNTDWFEVKSFFETKDLSTTDAAGGALITPQRIPGVAVPADRPLTIRDLLSVQPTQSEVEYARETGFRRPYTTLSAGIAGAATVIPVRSTSGFRAGQKITIGTDTDSTIQSIDSATQLTITAGVTGAQSSGAEVFGNDGVFSPTAEGGVKPEVDINFELKTAVPQVIAAHVIASRQVMSDAPQMQQNVDQRLTYAVRLSEEWQLLWGDGTAPNLTGLLTDAARQQHSKGADSKLDALRKAATKSYLAHYPPTGIVLHPNDKEEIDLAKSATDGHYLLAASTNAQGLPAYWRLPVAESITIGAGRGLVGALALAATLYDREAANVRVSESHGNLFLENRVVILGEERAALAISRPEAVTDVNLAA